MRLVTHLLPRKILMSICQSRSISALVCGFPDILTICSFRHSKSASGLVKSLSWYASKLQRPNASSSFVTTQLSCSNYIYALSSSFFLDTTSTKHRLRTTTTIHSFEESHNNSRASLYHGPLIPILDRIIAFAYRANGIALRRALSTAESA